MESLDSNYFEVMTGVLACDLDTAHRMLLLVIAFHARGTRGTCTASLATLGREVGVHQRRIRARLRVLIDQGWLSRVEVPGHPAALRIVDYPGRWRPTPGLTPDAGVRGDTSTPDAGVLPTPDAGVLPSLLPEASSDSSGEAERQGVTLLDRVADEAGSLPYRQSTKDLAAVTKRLAEGYSPDDLRLVWLYFNDPCVGATAYARAPSRGRPWAHHWTALLNHNLDVRLADARAYYNVRTT